MLTMFPGVTSDQVTWVTVSAWSVSLLTAPIIVHICRDHSVRLIAVIGSNSYSLMTASTLFNDLTVHSLMFYIVMKYIRVPRCPGGLSMNLSFLFASFGHQLHQVFISYGLLFGVSCAAVRETSSMMVGQYFKMRRDLAEMWSLSGVGMGILVFSLLYFQAIG